MSRLNTNDGRKSFPGSEISKRFRTFAPAMTRSRPSTCSFVSCLMLLMLLAACYGPQRRQMLALLDEADSLNRAYAQLPSDSLLRDAADFFDRHGSPNEQLRAHYLLGCAYRDMGEAPQAIDCYLNAAAKADTTASDCDFSRLGCVYSQMGDQYYNQLLFANDIQARKMACHYAILAGDTLGAIADLKLSAASYILLNKMDSAELILLEALRQYEENGLIQESLKSSTMLMSIYATKPERLKDLKMLIDRFEMHCDLFDEHRELPPSRRQYYYYKGKYYEGIGLLDSAEYCYRKIYRPDMSFTQYTPLYAGLLSIFQKCHQPDSIAKYARLYCLTNDSSITIKDQEMTARLSASYQYGRFQQEAAVNAERAADAKQRNTFLMIAIFVIVATFVSITSREREKQKKQREEFNKAIAERTKLQTELESLHACNYNNLIAQKEEEIDKLSQTIEKIVPAYQKMKERDAISGFVESNIVAMFLQKSENPQHGMPTNIEWKCLEREFEKNLPSVYEQMKILSPLQRQVCILLLLDYEESIIAVLRNTKTQTINTAKMRANQKMFQTNDAASLKTNLRKLI